MAEGYTLIGVIVIIVVQLVSIGYFAGVIRTKLDAQQVYFDSKISDMSAEIKVNHARTREEIERQEQRIQRLEGRAMGEFRANEAAGAS